MANVNLQMYLGNKFKMREKLEFLYELSRNCKLKELDFRGNNLTSSTVIEIVAALADCQTLERICFHNEK